MTEELKPMIYEDWHKTEVLGVGEYKGVRWVITSVGNHPCAYVCISGTRYWHMNRETLENTIECHFGVTYVGYLNHVPEARDGKKYVGWDYGHYTDYLPYRGEYGDKWTSEAVLSEIKGVIDDMTRKKTNYRLIARRVRETAKHRINFLDKKEVLKVVKKLRGYYAKLKEAPKMEEIASALGQCERLIHHYEVFL